MAEVDLPSTGLQRLGVAHRGDRKSLCPNAHVLLKRETILALRLDVCAAPCVGGEHAQFQSIQAQPVGSRGYVPVFHSQVAVVDISMPDVKAAQTRNKVCAVPRRALLVQPPPDGSPPLTALRTVASLRAPTVARWLQRCVPDPPARVWRHEPAPSRQRKPLVGGPANCSR